MSAVVCGKRSSFFEDIPSSPPVTKRICFSNSPVRYSPPRSTNAGSPSSSTSQSPFSLPLTSPHLLALDYLIAFFPDMDTKIKEQAISTLLDLLRQENRVEDLRNLLTQLHPFFSLTPKAKTGQMNYYENDFEAALREDSGSYYKRKASNWILEDYCPDYMLKSSFQKFSLDCSGDPCLPRHYSWTGVTCSNGSRIRITALNLTSMSLSGSLSSSIANLTALTDIWLGNNNLTGSVPDLSQLKRLETLHLEYNHLTGEIPSSLGSIDNLRELFMLIVVTCQFGASL